MRRLRTYNESIKDLMTPISDEKKDEIFDNVVDEVIDILIKEWDYHYEENARNWAVNHKYEIVKLLSEGNPLINTVHILVMGWDYEPVDDREETNESIRDTNGVGLLRSKMTPKPKESIIQNLKELYQEEKNEMLLKLDVRKLGDIDMIKYLIEAGADVNAKDKYGSSTMSIACSHGEVELVKYLIENGADVNICTHEGRTPIMAATSNGFPEIIEILVRNGANVNAQDDDDERTALHEATAKLDVDCVKKLLALGADITIMDDIGQTPLDMVGSWKGTERTTEIRYMLQDKVKEKEHNRPMNRIKRFLKFNESVRDLMKPKSQAEIIQSFGHMKPQQIFEVGIDKDIMWLIEYALQQGADPNFYKKVKTLGHLLEQDISVDRKELLKLLIKHNININFKDGALLVWCVRKKWLDMVKLLIKKGINVNGQQGEALMWACNIDSPELVQLLVDNGADVTLYPNLLSNYSEYGYMEIVELLLSNGKFLQGEKDRALRHACFRGHLSTIKVLVKHGADIHTGNDAPIMVSAVNNQLDLVKYFVSQGADVQCQKNMPLQRAAHYGHIEMIELLISYGANILDDNNAALVEAVSQGQLQTVKLLLKLGANANDVSRHTLEHINTNKAAIVRLIKQHQWYENKIKKDVNESIRDFMTPKPKDDIKKVLDRLPERERLIKGISMEVYDNKDVDEMLGGLSPREYFIRSTMVEKGLPIEKRRLVTKAMSLIKPYKKVKIGDLLTVPSTVTRYGEKIDEPQPLYEIVQKITFFNREDFHKFIKEYQDSTKHDVMADYSISDIYRSNSWKKVNCVVVLAKNRNRYGSFERNKNTYIIYDYGRTTGVFKYTQAELDEYEKGS